MLQNKRVRKFFVFVTILFACFFAQTQLASAQLFVPVIDIRMDVRFPQFMSDFNNYVTNLFRRWDNTFGAATPNGTTDSLRDLITGSNPGGLARVPCANGDNLGMGLANEPLSQPMPAFAYTDGPWASAVASTTGVPGLTALPSGIPAGATAAGPYVQVNYSNSLRCLLKDIAEYQKLGISIQIHDLLKTYIADAQTKQLNNQLMNQVAAANIDWSKAGNEVNNNGVISNEAVYNTNLSQSAYNKNARQLDHVIDQAAADPLSGNPVGSLGICEPWRLDTTANMVRNSRAGVEDPINFTQSETECKLDAVIAPNDYSKFSANFNDPSSIEGGVVTFDAMLLNTANSPLGAATQAYQVASTRIERQKETTKAENSNTGFTPTKVCSGDATDPYCLDQQNSTAISPAGQNQQAVTDMAKQGDIQIQNGNTLDAKGGPDSEIQSTELNTNSGVYGFDTTPLQTSKTVVNMLVKEFYDAIDIGYFGIHQNTTQWAQGTMLMIYDEMKFDDAGTNVVVTDGNNPYDTGY